MASGPHVAEHARLLVEQANVLGDAKFDSLLKAYERAGVPLDDNALQEIKNEVVQYTTDQQHSAVGSVAGLVRQTFGRDDPGLSDAMVQQIVRGFGSVISRLVRDIDIRRAEAALDDKKVRRVYAAGLGKQWDVFISHASEDKDDFVRPLARLLTDSGLIVWYDEATLRVGDSLRQRIDEGLARSRYGIVILSQNFFAKSWPQQELDGLMSREIAGTKVILPVWHNVSHQDVVGKSPLLTGRLAARSDEGLEVVVRKLREAMGL